MHLAPSEGLPRNVAAPVIDMLYPPGKPSRIPIIAVTGTNGKTTTTRLLAHIVKNNGYKVGFTTSDGIYIQNHMLEKGDTTGPISAEYIYRYSCTVVINQLRMMNYEIRIEGLPFCCAEAFKNKKIKT